MLNLGLIGSNISASRAPQLHSLAGELCGVDVSYELIDPVLLGCSFADALSDAAARLRGVNVTHPYKEQAADAVIVADVGQRALGAVNTVLFDADERGGRSSNVLPVGYNTDYSGFCAAYRNAWGARAPGDVCVVGAGGVGKAVAFALLELGASALRIVDVDEIKAQLLGFALQAVRPDVSVTLSGKPEHVVRGAQGVVNCTPIGMSGHAAGTPVARALLSGAEWAFDAVYTPVETEFLRAAAALGLDVLSGYELFFYQGVHAFEHFSGRSVDEAALRGALAQAARRAAH